MKGTGFLVGAVFGFLVAAAGLSQYDVIHDMLLLREPDVFLLMGSAVAVAAPLLLWLERKRWRTPFGGAMKVTRAPITSDTVKGAAVFGAGWAIAGTCPVPALAMTAGGSVLGLCVAAGLFGGVAVRDAMTKKPAADAGC